MVTVFYISLIRVSKLLTPGPTLEPLILFVRCRQGMEGSPDKPHVGPGWELLV